MSGARLTWLVARRELREGLRGRTFLVSSLAVLAILAGVIALPALLGDPGAKVTLGVVGAQPAGLAPALDRAAEPFDATVTLRGYPSAAAAREAVARRKVDAALLSGSRSLVVRPDPDGNVVTIASVAQRSLDLPRAAQRLGIAPSEAAQLLAPPLRVTEVEPATGADDAAEFLAFICAVLLFIALSIYGQSVLMSVVQEKASRVVEVLLATLRPHHLLGGKVVGIGLLGLAQIALLLGAALVADGLGWVDAPSLGRTAPLALLWFLLGYGFYAVAFAAAGALVSRIEDASSASLPITMTMLAGYLVSFGGALSNPDGALAVFLSIFPLSSPFIVASRAAVTDVPLWQHGAGIGLMLAAIWALVRLGGRMYELGLLRSGPPVPFREALAVLRAR